MRIFLLLVFLAVAGCPVAESPEPAEFPACWQKGDSKTWCLDGGAE